jgi:hypothetical protein
VAEVIQLFPGVGVAPAPGPRVDLDAIGDRYTALLEARETAPTSVIALLAAACADDIPALVAEIAYVERLRVELAAELDRVTGHA